MKFSQNNLVEELCIAYKKNRSIKINDDEEKNIYTLHLLRTKIYKS